MSLITLLHQEQARFQKYLAGRDELLKNAEKSIIALVKGYPQQSVVYYGLRGVGKTVLLNAIEEKADLLDILYAHIEVAEKRIFLQQISSYSKQLIHKMSTSEKAKAFAQKAMAILQAFSITYNPNDQTFSALDYLRCRHISQRVYWQMI